MKKISKIILKSILWFIAIVIVLVGITYLSIGYWVPPVIKRVVPQYTKTAASLDKIDISLIKGKISLAGLKIANPAGYANPNAFELGKIDVVFQPKTLFQNKIIIDSVMINGTKVDTEMNQKLDMNLVELNNNVQSALPKSEPTAKVAVQAEQQKPATKQAKSVVIRDLQINNSTLKFGFMGKTVDIKLPNLQQKNIGEQQKLSIKDSIIHVFNMITTESLKQVQQFNQQVVSDSLNKLIDKTKSVKIKGVMDSIQGLF